MPLRFRCSAYPRVEYGRFSGEADVVQRVQRQPQQLQRHPTSGMLGYRHVSDGALSQLYQMRKAVGLLGRVEGLRRPIAFVEDTAVTLLCLLTIF